MIRATRDKMSIGNRLAAVLVLFMFCQVSLLTHDASHAVLDQAENCVICLSQEHSDGTIPVPVQAFYFSKDTRLPSFSVTPALVPSYYSSHAPRAPPLSAHS